VSKPITTFWVQILVVWALLSAGLAWVAISGGDAFRITGDDAMRLVGAIDLLEGQSWFDTTQTRDNAPYGAPMHWSRLIDLPLASLIRLFGAGGSTDAPYWAAFAWPLLVLLTVVALLARLTDLVAGPAARLPALALLAMTTPLYFEFEPGRVDHHNVQIALTLGTVIATILARTTVRWAMLAGILTAAGIAIGTEALPSAIAALICIPLFWAVNPKRSVRPLKTFALAFAATLAILWLATMPSGARWDAACDALSIVYVTAGVAYAATMVATACLPDRLVHRGVRIVVLVMAGVGCLAVVVWLFPDCAAGPYGNLDPELARTLLPTIGEAQSVWVWAQVPHPRLALLVTPLTCVVALGATIALAPTARRWRWLVLGGFCVQLFIAACAQVRGIRLLSFALLPAPAYVVAVAWSRFQSSRTWQAAILGGAAMAAFSGMVHLTVLSAGFALAPSPRVDASASASTAACMARASFSDLAALPPGRVMSYLMIGPQLLLETRHSVVSAGYHRNETGLRDMVRFFQDGEAAARAVAEERGLDYLVFCRGISPSAALAGVPDFDGLHWPWLARRSGVEDPLQVYEIML
jgi:hypothetical protein